MQDLFTVEHEGHKIRVEYDIKTKNSDTQISYSLELQESSLGKSTMNVLPLLSKYEANLIQMSENIVQQYQRKDKNTKVRKIPEIHKSNPLNIIGQLKKDFNLLQSFKKRKISTFFENEPVALTIVDIFGDMKTLVLNNRQAKNFASFHALNVKFSEFIIASRLKSFIHNMIKISEILAIPAGFVGGIAFFGILNDLSLNLDNIETRLWDLSIGFGIPGIISAYFRKWIGKKFLTIAINHIFDKLEIKPEKVNQATTLPINGE